MYAVKALPNLVRTINGLLSPSVSLGWTISNEKFMEGLTWLNNLKLRAGYGVTGVIVGDSYNSLTRYEYGSPYFYDNGVWHQG